MLRIRRSIEEKLSFATLGAALSVCSDFATPFAGSGIKGVVLGGVILGLGLLSWVMFQWKSKATRGLIGVGSIMTALSLYFFIQTPPDKAVTEGFLSSRFETLARLQHDIIGSVNAIHTDTNKIASNTEALVDKTDDLRGYSISDTRFDEALSNGDERTVTLACKSGLRASDYIFFGGSSRDEPVETYRDPKMIKLLIDQSCVPKEIVCRELFLPEHMGNSIAQFAIQSRVETICGVDALKKVKTIQADYDDRMSKPFFTAPTDDLKVDLDKIYPKTQ